MPLFGKFLVVPGVLFVLTIGYSTYHLTRRDSEPTSQLLELARSLPSILAETANATGTYCLDSLTLSTAAERVHLTKFFYYLSAGLPSGAQFCNSTFTGLVPLVNSLTSNIGAVLGALGKTTCESIPTTGSESVQDGGTTWTFNYATGSRTIPTFFQSQAGGTLEKRVTIAKNSTNVLLLEATCSNTSTLTSGFLRADFDDARKVEFYFQKDTATNNGNLTLATISGNSEEKQIIQFSVTGGTTFSIRQAIAHATGTKGYFIGMSGIYGGKTQLYLKLRNNHTDNTDILSSPDHSECLNMATAATETGCTALGGPSAQPVGPSSVTLSINGAAGLTGSSFTTL